jgi:FixJ family two-component response regulator
MPGKSLIGIVDDDADIPLAISSLVRSLGYSAECFASAQELLDRLNSTTFCCVISDIHMPAMDGMDLTRALGATAPGLPVILMTGRNEEGLKERAYAVGAASFVTKPFNFETLSEKLTAALKPK